MFRVQRCDTSSKRSLIFRRSVAPTRFLDEVTQCEMLIRRYIVSAKCLFGERGLDEMSCTPHFDPLKCFVSRFQTP